MDRAADEHHTQPAPPAGDTTGTEVMTVTVRDHETEAAHWGRGPLRVITRTVGISPQCPRCGGPRGEPKGVNLSEDGAFYWVQQWANPCGHTDTYAAVLREAKEHYPQYLGKKVSN